MNYLQPAKVEFDLFVFFLKKNLLLLSALILIIILSYGFKLTHFWLGIDEEVAFNGGSSVSSWFSQGRFGIAVIKQIFNTATILPFWNTFLSIVFLLLSCLVFIFILHKIFSAKKIKGSLETIILFVFGALYLSFPTNAVYISFSTYNFEVSVGSFFISLATLFAYDWCFRSKKTGFFFLCLFFLVYAVGIYQSFILFFLASISSILILSPIKNNKRQLIMAVRLALLSILAITIYILIDHGVHLFIPSSSYLDSFVYWGKVNSREIFVRFLNYYNVAIFNNKQLFFGQLFLVSTIICLLVLSYRKLLRTPLFLMMLVSPFLFTVALGSPTPIRTMQAVPYLIGFFWVFILVSIKNSKLRGFLIAIALFFIVYQTQQISLLFFSDYLRYQEDVTKANNFARRITSLNFGDQPPFPVVFTGYVQQKQELNHIKMETLGYSFFEWDNGNPYRMLDFMQVLGNDYLVPTAQQVALAQKLQVGMPSWPDERSVAKNGNLIIVKLSESQP